MAGSVLPSGTVTFLFTDVEGSTKLLHELGAEGYAAALAEHRRVLREALGQGGGVEVDTQGDAFFVAYPTAPGALEAARAAQSELSIPVRIGIHTGTPLEYSLEAAELFRDLEDETGIAVALLNTGWCALVLGDAVLAVESLREAMAIAGRVGAIHWIANGALALGAVLAGGHEEERGAQFLAAGAALREELGIGFNDAVEERIHERAVAKAKAALGKDAFAAGWARGQAMQPDEIVKLCDGRDGSGRPMSDRVERSVTVGDS